MPLHYEKIKHVGEQGAGFWTLFGNLAVIMSILFLLLLVTTVLRTTSVTLAEKAANQRLAGEILALKRKLAIYDAERPRIEELQLDVNTKSDALAATATEIATLKRNQAAAVEKVKQKYPGKAVQKKAAQREIASAGTQSEKRLIALQEKYDKQKKLLDDAQRVLESRNKSGRE